MEHILNLEQVKKYYGGNSGNITKAVDGISMYVDKGEFVAIMGASGSGKTTLLNCISTIDTVTSGHITVNNQDITKIKDKDFADFRRENLGFIFQDFNLLDTLTIGENISLSLVIKRCRNRTTKSNGCNSSQSVYVHCIYFDFRSRNNFGSSIIERLY